MSERPVRPMSESRRLALLGTVCEELDRIQSVAAERLSVIIETTWGPRAAAYDPQRTSHGSGVSDPTADAAGVPDGALADLVRFDQLLRLMDRVTREATGILHRYGSHDERPRMLLERAESRTGSGDCRACGIYCSGAHGDRLRSAYCAACYSAWLRWRESAPEPDRATFERERRAWLDDQQKGGRDA